MVQWTSLILTASLAVSASATSAIESSDCNWGDVYSNTFRLDHADLGAGVVLFNVTSSFQGEAEYKIIALCDAKKALTVSVGKNSALAERVIRRAHADVDAVSISSLANRLIRRGFEASTGDLRHNDSCGCAAYYPNTVEGAANWSPTLLGFIPYPEIQE